VNTEYDLERQSNRNLALFYEAELKRLHYEDVSYGTVFPEKTTRHHLKKHGIVFRPDDKPKWYAELTQSTKEVLRVE
jgi:hypothetical protein